MSHLLPWITAGISIVVTAVSLFTVALSGADPEGRGGGWVEVAALVGILFGILGVVTSGGLIIWNAFH
jgi:hypothetical protein